MKNYVREVREKRNISGAELARRAKLSPSDLSKLEKGQRQSFPGWRARIASALGLPETDLFPEEAPNSVTG